MSCDLAHLDGAYVLDALAPGERQAFERHLADCTACAVAVRELAGLPGLLGRLDPEVLAAPAVALPVPDTLLPALVREVRRARRRRVLVTAGLAVAAGVAVVVGLLTSLGVVGAGAPGSPPDAGGRGDTGQSTGQSTAQAMVAVGPGPVSARLAFESVAWGTRLHVVCTYDAVTYPDDRPRPAAYALVVRTRDGGTEQVATWRALPGRTMTLSAATAARRDEIVSVEVRTADGEPVLELTT